MEYSALFFLFLSMFLFIEKVNYKVDPLSILCSYKSQCILKATSLRNLLNHLQLDETSRPFLESAFGTIFASR